MDFSSTTPHTVTPEAEVHENVQPAIKTLMKTLTAGGIAGIIAKTCSAPMDRIKIIFQTDSQRHFTLRKAAIEGRRVVVEEGVHNLWRGNSATVVRVFPYAGIQFAAFDVFNQRLQRIFKTNKSDSKGGSGLTMAHFAERMLSGSGAGATAVLFTYPLDVIRARMAVQTNTVVYKSLIHAGQHMIQNEGLPSLWSGLRPTIIGIIPYAGLAFTGFHSIKSVVESDGTEFKWWHKLLAGGVAGLVAQTCTYPLDVVRRRMQTERFLLDVKSVSKPLVQGGKTTIETPPILAMQLGARRTWRGGGTDSSTPNIRYNSIMQTLRTIAHEEGMSGLFKGVQMNWIKGPMAVGISFAVNDAVLNYFNKKLDDHDSEL
jgi:solute carrier family 25, member 42